MKYFTKDYLDFFKELAANNNKDWFDKNRKRYETSVKLPFKTFIDELINKVAKEDSEVQITSKEAIFRINRDIRFAKDKTPYKTRNSAIVSKTGRKDKSYPGLYVELGPEKLGIYGGLFRPNTQQIQKVRTYIFNNSKQFEAIITDKKFKNLFGDIKGDKNKRIPKEFAEFSKVQPLILNKQWYYFASLNPNIILQDDLMDTILQYTKDSSKIKNFLKAAINS